MPEPGVHTTNVAQQTASESTTPTPTKTSENGKSEMPFNHCSPPQGYLDQSLVNHNITVLVAALKDENPAQRLIAELGMDLTLMLLSKNRKYGNSALDPLRIFSDLPPMEGIKIRLDDKLSRIKAGAADEDEDPILDLEGYLLLYRVARRLDIE